MQNCCLDRTMKKNLSLFPDSKLPKSNLENLKKFLTNLKSSHQKNYKRYLGSPLRYAGGKSLAVGLIVEKIPYNIQKIVSPFLGGASVEIACAKELGLEVVAYDIFDLLANYWQVQQNQPEELAKKLRQWKPTKEKYTEVKETLKKHWKKEETKQNKVELAALIGSIIISLMDLVFWDGCLKFMKTKFVIIAYFKE